MLRPECSDLVLRHRWPQVRPTSTGRAVLRCGHVHDARVAAAKVSQADRTEARLDLTRPDGLLPRSGAGRDLAGVRPAIPPLRHGQLAAGGIARAATATLPQPLSAVDVSFRSGIEVHGVALPRNIPPVRLERRHATRLSLTLPWEWS